MGLLKGNQHGKQERWQPGDLEGICMWDRESFSTSHVHLWVALRPQPRNFQVGWRMNLPLRITSSSTSSRLEMSEAHPSSPLLLKEFCFPCISSSMHLQKFMNYDFLKIIPWQILYVWSGLHFLIFMSISYPLFLGFWTSDTIHWPQERDYSASWEIQWRDWVI